MTKKDPNTEKVKREALNLGEELKKESLPEKMMRSHENMKGVRG